MPKKSTTGNMLNIPCKVPPELKARFDEYCNELGETASAASRALIAKGLDANYVLDELRKELALLRLENRELLALIFSNLNNEFSVDKDEVRGIMEAVISSAHRKFEELDL